MMPNPTPSCLIDNFSRKATYLRISVTDRCNLRCRYCAPSMPKPMTADKLMTWPEMLRLVQVGISLGINKVRLTGGEPLCREGISDFIRELTSLEALKDISLTTNGTLLDGHARELKNAGLKRINISLDTLDPNRFRELTRFDHFDAVWRGIMTAADVGFSPVKINMVVMRGFNDDEVEQMAQLSMRYPFHIRFIEYMPIGTDPSESQNHFVSIGEIHDRLNRIAPLSPVPGTSLDGPATRYRFAEAPGEIGLIGSMSAHFCATCNRLRLTAGGGLRPCLLSEETTDLLSPLRGGASDADLAALFTRTIRRKKEKHQMDFTKHRILKTKMVSIGG